MAINIIVQTIIESSIELKKNNLIYDSGTIIFDKEGYRLNNGTPISSVKIGDGKTEWTKLSYLNIAEEIVTKWRKLAEEQGFGINNSKIVTLPDVHFAYMIVDAEKNSELIEAIMKTLIADAFYYKVSKNNSNILNLKSSDVLDFSIPSSLTTETISGISFTAKENTTKVSGTKTYNFKDEAAWVEMKKIENNFSVQINNLEKAKNDFATLNIKSVKNNPYSVLSLYLNDKNGELLSKSTVQIVANNGQILDENGEVESWEDEMFYFVLRHRDAPSDYYTLYRFPPITNKSSKQVYDIVTTNPDSNYIMPIQNGGTGASNKKSACTNLNAVYMGSDVASASTLEGQKIYSNLTIQKDSTNKLTVGGYTSNSIFRRGICLNASNWIAYAITDEDDKLKYCLGNDSVYVKQGTSVLRGAAWNDYAEAREVNTLEAGRTVVEKGDGSMVVSTQRLMPGAKITSDTFGFIIGETKTCKTPIAVCGRVLAYPNEDRNIYSLGDAVCSGPNGTVSKMTREEIINYPERIIGTVSEIPNYEVWGEEKVSVNGRIWIYVK